MKLFLLSALITGCGVGRGKNSLIHFSFCFFVVPKIETRASNMLAKHSAVPWAPRGVSGAVIEVDRSLDRVMDISFLPFLVVRLRN